MNQLKPIPGNVKIIANMLAAERKRTGKRVPGRLKDYVVIAGYRIIDVWSTHDIKMDNGETIGVEGVKLVHKSKLHSLIGKTADAFWNQKLRRRVHPR
jgi:hypothetical protein